MTIHASAIDAAEKAVATAQNVPFVGARQRNVAGAVLQAVAADLQGEALRNLRSAIVDELDVAQPANYEEDDWAAGYIRGLIFVRELIDVRVDKSEGKSE